MATEQEFTPRQLARAVGASEASMKRWCDKGMIETHRTDGGHRRIPLQAALRYLRDRGKPIAQPEILGLPTGTGTSGRGMAWSATQIREATEAGDEERARRVTLNLYLSGKSCSEIFDECLAVAFHEIGMRWSSGETAIFEERRCCEIAIRLIHELRGAVPQPPEEAPVAIGGTLSDDPYSLPTAMVEVALRERGWNARSYGVNLPVDTFCDAIDMAQPSLVWLSVGALPKRETLVEECTKLYAATDRIGCAFVVGGRIFDDELRKQLQYSAYCDNIQHLESFLKTLRVS